MQVSNTASGLYMYPSQAEVEHLGGIGIRVDVEMGSHTWIITPRSSGRYRILKQKGNRTNPGRISLPRRVDLNQWGSTAWASSLREGRTVNVTVGVMDTPLSMRGRRDEPSTKAPKTWRTPLVIQHDAPSLNLRDAIEEVNKHRDRLGEHLVLDVDGKGYLRATVEYGRAEQ